jgi:asparagine synthase (glutamine-hydrolysing)
MCGIGGFIGRGDRPVLERMIDALEHRGPDGAGLWHDQDVYLGMRRLAIIDLQTGQQPIFNEDENLVVVFNGEIYNHVELRQDLVSAGHRFRTDHSDTEVLVHLYEEYGPDFLHRLNGMFAFALWDRRARRLFAARDRMGIKPFYYAVVAGSLIFGSEPKALLAHPLVTREPDLEALHHYLTFKNIPAPLSAFRAIRQLRAGEYAIWEDGQLRTKRWWRVRFREDNSVTEQDAASHVRALLDDSVRLQMRSDVPVGAYLSGGLDSSSVVALMATHGAKNIDTFTLTYDDRFPSKDEDRLFARRMADRCGTRHHEHIVSPADVPASIDAVINAFDEPFSGVISTYFLSSEIRRHVKVALSGDGADELFGSYLAHRVASPLAAYASGRTDTASLAPFDAQPEFLERLMSRGDETARRMGLYIADDEAKLDLYTPEMRAAVIDAPTETLVREAYAQSGTVDPLNRALFVDIDTLLADQVLPFVDRLSMAHSVEVRPPFLDHRLVEFVATLPGTMKIKGGLVKYLLKKSVSDLLPTDLVNRAKEGFIMPINEWMLLPLRNFVEATLSPARLKRHGLLEAGAVNRILHDHYVGRASHGNRLWNLLMLQLWWDRFQT